MCQDQSESATDRVPAGKCPTHGKVSGDQVVFRFPTVAECAECGADLETAGLVERRLVTDGGSDESGVSRDEEYYPETGEVVELTGFSWDPWVLITDVRLEKACFVIMDNMDDDVYTPMPDSDIRLLEDTIGDRTARQELAEGVAARDEVDVLTAPFDRFEPLNELHIQGAPPKEEA